MLAFLIAPVAVVALLLLLLFGAEVAFGGGTDIATSRALGVAPYLLAGTLIIFWTGGLIAFLLLWAIRMRRRRAYAVAGMTVGLIAALAVPLFSGQAQSVGPVPIIVMTVHFGIVMLFLRWIAGVRSIHD
jgi:hypothetical protein